MSAVRHCSLDLNELLLGTRDLCRLFGRLDVLESNHHFAGNHCCQNPYDDQIYAAFRQDFPDLNIKVLTDNDLKTPEEKIKWRAFIEKFNKLDDFSLGTLLRGDCEKEFDQENAVLVTRVQFWAIEIARNREGYNDGLREKYKTKPKTSET